MLFEVFFEMVKGVERGEHSHMSILNETVVIAGKIGYMAAGDSSPMFLFQHPHSHPAERYI